MALILKDKLELLTPLGVREIQLLIGDITQLPVEEKVDFIFTSAFYDDYSPIPHTLIGSLERNLGISVFELSKQKAADLRDNFSCWISNALPQHAPYRRLVCFERKSNTKTLTQQLSEMFRAMMPVFNNTETTVITPLLAAGDQGQSPLIVMHGMINGACEWIKAGLPLSCLKLVIYSSNPQHLTEKEIEYCQLFSTLKEKWHEEEDISGEEGGPYDVSLSFAPEDKGLTGKVIESLKHHKPDIIIYSEGFVFKEDCIWQAEIYGIMKNSTKIIIVLTPAYINNINCLEEYSMALCCNQLKKAEVVIPLYLETIPTLPSYMILVQYKECRVRKEGEMPEAMLDGACTEIIKSIHHYTASANDSVDSCSIEALKITREVKYDIFVSYSHRTAKEPLQLVEFLRHNYPDINVFFDKSELRAGNLWQQALYEAVDKVHCMVAFLSPGYIQSAVCNEELNIALARQHAHDTILLIPVHTEALQTIPRRMSSVPCVDLGNGESNITQLGEKLVEMVMQSKGRQHMPDVKLFKQRLEDKRAFDFKEKFRLDGGQVVRTAANSTDGKLEGEIVFSFAQDYLKLAAIMSVIIKQLAPGLVCHLKASSQSQRRTYLDSADMVVIFVSDQYVSSQQLIEELHTVLCRQRADKDNTVVYLIQCDHDVPTPFYLHALPFSISLDDKLWLRLQRASSNKNPRFMVNIDGMEGRYRCTSAQNLALTAAVHDIVYILTQRGTGTKLPYNIVNIAQLENEMEGIKDEDIHVHEHIITLASINHLMCKEYSPPSPRPQRKSVGHIETHLRPNKIQTSDAQQDETVRLNDIPQTESSSDTDKSVVQKPHQDMASANPQPDLKIFQVQSTNNETTEDDPIRSSKVKSQTEPKRKKSESGSLYNRLNSHPEYSDTPAIHHDLRDSENRRGSRLKRSSKTCVLL